jgi:acetyltransferase
VNDPLHTFFHPRGVAIVGASSSPHKLSHGVLRNLKNHGYEGPIYPVNPKGGEILELPVYPAIADVPDPVELAVIILPPELSVQALEACGRRGIEAAVVVASGFGELGTGGEEREAQLQAVARRHGLRFIGPNCIGVLDTYTRVDTTFLRKMPQQGNIGFVSHSGAICGGTLDWADTVGVGFSRVLSLGNQVDVKVPDALSSLAADPHTEVVAAYVEGLPEGQRFVEVASALTPHKPLVVVKAGRTPSGTRAVASHTGALAGADRAFQAACRRAGALQVEDLEALMDASLALAYREPLPGPRIALLTNAGGPSAVGADALDRLGLRLVALSDETQTQLQAVCPPGTMTGNPVDMLGGAEPSHFAAALEILLDAPEVDGVMTVFVPQALTGPPEVAEAVARAAGDAVKPAVCCIYGGAGVDEAAQILHAQGVPGYMTPARAAFGLSALRRYHQIQARPVIEPAPFQDVDRARAKTIVAEAQAAGEGVLDAQAGAELAESYGLTPPPSGLADTPDEAAALAEASGYPVALKRVALGLVHKSDVGGVTLGLEDADAVREAFAQLIQDDERGFVQRMAPQGLEVIVGAQRDPQFGPLVMFGLGGAYVEVLKDVAFRLAPLSEAEAREMVAETAAGQLLEGVRGQPPGDIDAVVEALRRVSRLMLDLPAVAEVDLNPLIVGEAGEGAWAVDVRVILEETNR